MTLKLLVPTLAAGALLAVPAVAGAATVKPVYVSGHPSCYERGYDHEIKFHPAETGTRSEGGVSVSMTVGKYVDWTASKPIAAVIAAGGAGSNVYAYADGSAGDTGLRAPDGRLYKPYKVRFCWDDEKPQPPAPPVPPAPETPAPPVETPAPPAPAAPPAAPAAPAVVPAVVPATTVATSSKLIGPSGCVGRIVNARVTGTGIVKATFRLDGKVVKTVGGPGSLRVRTATLREGVHKIKARVVFADARARTHVVSFQRCIARRIVPRFAG